MSHELWFTSAALTLAYAFLESESLEVQIFACFKKMLLDEATANSLNLSCVVSKELRSRQIKRT